MANASVLVGYQSDIGAAAGTTASAIGSTGSTASVSVLDASTTSPAGENGVVNVRPMNAGATDAAGAVAANTFFDFSISADSGFLLSLSSLTFDAYKGGDGGPRGWVLRSDLDSFSNDMATGLVTCHPFSAACTPDAFSVDLSATMFQDIDDITFRLYTFTANPVVYVVNYTNIRLTGEVVESASVPAPGTMSLLGLALVGLAVSRRRQAHSSRNIGPIA